MSLRIEAFHLGRYWVPIAIFLVGLLLGSAITIYIKKFQENQDIADRTTAQLVFITQIIQKVQQGNVKEVRRGLLDLADGNVVQLIQLDGFTANPEIRRLQRYTFKEYGKLRKQLPESELIPSYIKEDERDSYLESGRRIQEFLESRKE